MKAFSTPGGHYRVDRPSLDEFLRTSGVSLEKKKVLVMRMSSAERDEFIQGLRKDDAFALMEEGSTPSGERQGAPCVILLEVSPSPKKASSAKGALASLRQ